MLLRTSHSGWRTRFLSRASPGRDPGSLPRPGSKLPFLPKVNVFSLCLHREMLLLEIIENQSPPTFRLGFWSLLEMLGLDLSHAEAGSLGGMALQVSWGESGGQSTDLVELTFSCVSRVFHAWFIWTGPPTVYWDVKVCLTAATGTGKWIVLPLLLRLMNMRSLWENIKEKYIPNYNTPVFEDHV